MRRKGGKSMNLKKLLLPENRVIFISLSALLMLCVIVIVGQSVIQSGAEAYTPSVKTPGEAVLPDEAGVFKQSDQALYYLETLHQQGSRTLAAFYERRAFDGAPPVIPHEVTDERSVGGNTCLQCHENGGFVPKFNAYAPVSPHPQFLSCRQCHVPVTTRNVFRASGFTPVKPPAINRSALTGAPPQIPHDLQMRENCLACHGGPASVREIRTPHPDRVNCRQCHGAIEDNTAWIRPAPTP
ncbi:nitrate reductase cytochrome c-type subunit [bacterium]|nr:nitrate reductase cytochrome c-type subunit [bacterium]NUN45501.1 nitrate reductase cytochrome c-type subunit [bacterium]